MTIAGRRVAGVVFLLIGLAAAGQVLGCRCRPQPLAAYFDAADHVFYGRLAAARPAGDANVALEFDILAPSFKGAQARRLWLTGASSASCGLPVLMGRRYLLFAENDDERAGVSYVTTCNGSRMVQDDGEVADFVDVPARYVARQLEAMAASPADQHPGGVPGPDSIIGLLVLQNRERRFDLFAAARRTSTSTAEVMPAELEQRELSYEQPAIVVTETAPGGWYRVRHGGKPAWIHQPAASFRPLAEIVVNRLNYLTEAWNGVLWPAPGAGLPFRTRYATDRPREVPARVLGVEKVADSTWWRVEVLDAGPCEGRESRVVAAGYVPAWSVDGEPTAWYWSRGC